MSITIHDCLQGSEEWHQLRSGKYTGSNAHKLLRYGAGRYSVTEQSEFSGNFHTKRGHILEDEAIDLYKTICETDVQRPGFVTNSRFPSCGYSPDGIDSVCLLEVKCFSEAKHKAVAAGEIPLEIMAQIQFGLLICNLRKARLILYHPKLDPKLALKIIEIKRRQAVQANFKRILRQEVMA